MFKILPNKLLLNISCLCFDFAKSLYFSERNILLSLDFTKNHEGNCEYLSKDFFLVMNKSHSDCLTTSLTVILTNGQLSS